MKILLRLALLQAGLLTLTGGRLHAAEFNDRLANLSTRTQVGSGANVAVVGFVVGPGPAKNVLVRAVGPGLASFGVTGVISDPRIDLFDAGGRAIANNDNWATTSVGGATTFAAVGAFGLTTGSRDAALLTVPLAPGAYTAQVSGVGTATGIALIEVYDVTGPARLMNLSTRAQVGTGSGILITGFAVNTTGGRRQLLMRAAGPALAAFGVSGVLADPALAVIDGTGIQIAANDNWSSGANSVAIVDASAKAGAFAFVAGSRDAAAIVELAPGNYTIQVSGVGGGTGAALVEVYDITPEALPTVSVVATTAATDTKGAAPGVFAFTRTGGTSSPLTVYYQAEGTAVAGVDYVALPGVVTFPAGVSSVTLLLSARENGLTDPASRNATVALSAGAGYALGAPSAASVAIFYNPGTLYLASLRAVPTATGSTAYGTATIQLSSDGRFAVVDASFSNLSSPQTVAYLRLGNPGEVGTEVFRLPNGQVGDALWTISPSGAVSAADLVQALREGRIFLSIESAAYPAGELKGTFIQNSASLVFNPPAAPPALADAPLSAAEAARFLIQSTFGPTKGEIDALTGKRQADLAAWIDVQIGLPASLHLSATFSDFNQYTALISDNPQFTYQNRQAAWWKLALGAPDQLRQRVAFALSQLFVASDVPTTLFNNPLGLANYYDHLVRGAFGNFRALLETVTLSPIMGVYLSALRNSKATFDTRGEVITAPDENYAREIMQLFTIGLHQLQPDGTLKLDPAGKTIPTYDQRTITEVAKVFTGWSYFSDSTVPNFRTSAPNYMLPMQLFPAFHEEGAKTIVGGIQLPANQGGTKDLADTLDTLFRHANTGPFVARALIQRLVTSNPSPGYVFRVAQAFADNGRGVRGDLAAVVRTILTDYEARSPAVAASASFGKLKEPLLRATGILRAFDGGANNGRFAFFVAQTNESNLGQTALHAPTVFNFFEPFYVHPGPLAAAGLYAPEYQILTDTTALSIPNQLWNFIYANRSSGATLNPGEGTLGLRLDSLISLARTPAALVDRVNLILAGGGLPKAVTDRFVAAITAMPVGAGTTPSTAIAQDVERVRSAIYLTVAAPQGAVQK